MASNAIIDAKEVENIGFPEFTSKLITDTFEALINANVTQMEAYSELLEVTSVSLSAYINNTKNDVSPETILEFLAVKLPPLIADEDNQTSSIHKGKKLTEQDAEGLNRLIKSDAEAGRTAVVYEKNDTLDDSKWASLLDNIASVISQNKYQLLSEMVRQGMLRLVVDNGTIETRLNIHASSQKFTYTNASQYHRGTQRSTNRGRVGGIFSLFGVNTSNKSVRTSFKVSTARAGQNTRDETTVDISGGVTINFSTDYLKLTE